MRATGFIYLFILCEYSYMSLTIYETSNHYVLISSGKVKIFLKNHDEIIVVLIISCNCEC